LSKRVSIFGLNKRNFEFIQAINIIQRKNTHII
jgi:hypothetical protein